MAFRAVACTAFLTIFLTSARVHAECITTTPERLLKGSSELVFSGLVVGITWTAPESYRATFVVDRVWKGTVTRHFDIYIWQRAPETAGFELNKRYVVVARRLTNPEARKGAGLSDPHSVAYTQVPCTGEIELGPNMIADLGAGKPPQ